MSNSFLDDVKRDFGRRALWDLTKYSAFALVAVTWAYVGTGQLALKFGFLQPYRWPISITVSVLTLLTAARLFRRTRRFTPRFGRLLFDFVLVRKEIEYRRNIDGTIMYRRRLRLRAMRDGLDTYTDKYHWTGKGDSAPVAAIQGQTAYNTIRQNVWQLYEVRLQKTLHRKEEIDVDVVWTLTDPNHEAVPFFSATIEEPTQYLKLTLSLPPELGIKQVTYDISAGIGARRPFSSSLRPLDERSEISCEEKDPALLHHYELRWIY